MSQQKISNFVQLQTLSEQQLFNMAPNEVVDISLNSINNLYTAEIVFNFWRRKLLKICEVSEFSIENIHRFFNALADYTGKVLKKMDITLSQNESFTNISLLLSDWKNIVGQMDMAKLKLIKAAIIIQSALQALLSYYQLIISSKTVQNGCSDNYLQLLTATQDFQKIILSLMLDNFQFFICTENAHITNVVQIIKCLSNVGEIVPQIDVKLTAEIWKFLSKMILDNASIMKNTDEHANCLQYPILFLSEEIKKSILALYKPEYNQSSQKAERVVKINAFYLKILVKFSSVFEHEYFVGSPQVLHAGLTTMTPPEKCLGSHVSDLTQQHLKAGFFNLFSLIYKNTEFVQALNVEPIDSLQKFETFYSVTIEILKLLITETDSKVIDLYLVCQPRVVEKLFKGISTYSTIFLKKEVYENTVVVISALLLSKCNNPEVLGYFEELLIKGILQNDFLLANLCTDIWISFARFISCECRHLYFTYWLNYCMKFPILSAEPQAIYTRYLCRSFYDILTDKIKIFVWNSINSKETQKHILLILGSDRIVNFDKAISNQLIEETIPLLEKCKKNSLREQYQELLIDMSILKDAPTTPSERFQESVMNLLVHFLENFSNNHNQILCCSLLIEYVRTHIQSLTKHYLIRILDAISSKVNTLNNAIELHILKLAKEIFHAQNLQQKSNLRTSLIQCSHQSRKLQTIFHYIYRIKVENSGNFNNNANLTFFNRIRVLKYIHKCEGENVKNSTKRMRFEENSSLANVLNESRKIAEYFESRSPSVHEITLMEEIVRNFRNVMLKVRFKILN